MRERVCVFVCVREGERERGVIICYTGVFGTACYQCKKKGFLISFPFSMFFCASKDPLPPKHLLSLSHSHWLSLIDIIWLVYMENGNSASRGKGGLKVRGFPLDYNCNYSCDYNYKKVKTWQ